MVSERDVIAMVSDLTRTNTTFLTELGPLVLTSLAMDMSGDTRSFAKLFEVSHALTLRECNHLEDELGLLETENRGDKSGRLFLTLTPKGKCLTRVDVSS